MLTFLIVLVYYCIPYTNIQLVSYIICLCYLIILFCTLGGDRDTRTTHRAVLTSKILVQSFTEVLKSPIINKDKDREREREEKEKENEKEKEREKLKETEKNEEKNIEKDTEKDAEKDNEKSIKNTTSTENTNKSAVSGSHHNSIMDPNEPVYMGSKKYSKLFVFWQVQHYYYYYYYLFFYYYC